MLATLGPKNLRHFVWECPQGEPCVRGPFRSLYVLNNPMYLKDWTTYLTRPGPRAGELWGPSSMDSSFWKPFWAALLRNSSFGVSTVDGEFLLLCAVFACLGLFMGVTIPTP